LRWFTDQSADESLTEKFLAERIDNVMQFEKFKSQLSESMTHLPALSDVLHAFGGGRP
jgi:hypothetical protein